jgi:hypothetical protein
MKTLDDPLPSVPCPQSSVLSPLCNPEGSVNKVATDIGLIPLLPKLTMMLYSCIHVCMRTMLNIDAHILRRAEEITGVKEKTSLALNVLPVWGGD